MLPYGKSPKMRTNYTDCHPKRLRKLLGGGKWVNWWETELGDVDKGAERQRLKQKLKREINGEYNQGQTANS
jgi:hypothetical protein